MKASSIFVLLPLLAGLHTLALAETRGLHAGDNLAICGDSITEQKQYSVFLEDYLVMCQPREDLSAHQFGWSGETSWGFLARMQNDVLPFHPTAATTCYGMNDGAYFASDPDRQARYRQAMEDIVKNFTAAGVRFIVVGSPGAVDPEPFKTCPFTHVDAATYNKTLADLGDIARGVATEHGLAFADVHGAMISAIEKAKSVYGPTYTFARGDGVHPTPNGHLVMAYAFLKGMGCTGDIGTITYDFKADKAESDAGQKIVSAKGGTVNVRSTRYPFCTPADPDLHGARSALKLIPFNEELNRYVLVVKNLPGAKAKVTWGKETKEFSATDLEKGINLAAEFPDNPFSERFLAVETAIRKQQAFETPAIKSVQHAIPDLVQLLPDQKENAVDITRALVKKTNTLSATAREACTPVEHAITVVPEA